MCERETSDYLVMPSKLQRTENQEKKKKRLTRSSQKSKAKQEKVESQKPRKLRVPKRRQQTKMPITLERQIKGKLKGEYWMWQLENPSTFLPEQLVEK